MNVGGATYTGYMHDSLINKSDDDRDRFHAKRRQGQRAARPVVVLWKHRFA
ncbi:MAG: hypothetical protein ACLUHE_09165 [Christensenellales bacterium]